MDHLGEYKRLRDYVLNIKEVYGNDKDKDRNVNNSIRNSMINLINRLNILINMLWKAKISHNDFHFGNIMIRSIKFINTNPGKTKLPTFNTLNEPILKLIDYGNATHISKYKDITDEMYQEYFKTKQKLENENRITIIDISEGEGSNVQNLHEIVIAIKQAFNIK